MWYRCDFEISSMEDNEHCNVIGQQIDSEYFETDSDESAIQMGNEIADNGITYSDIGHCGLKLVMVCEVDEDTECFNDKRVVYY